MFNKLIRADSLENAVLQEVENFFGDMPDLDERIAALERRVAALEAEVARLKG